MSLALVFFTFHPVFKNISNAQGILRDAETEWFLRLISDPLFQVAGLDPNAVSMFILGDKELNAFVGGGQNVFINAGTIMKASDVNELIGVIAHETGHMSGGHLARRSENMAPMGNMVIAGVILGAAAILAGAPDAGMAMLLGGQSMAQYQALGYSRAQEATTDQAGAGFLEATGTSGKGIIEFFYTLRDQELLSAKRRDPYLQSHPLHMDRIHLLEERLKESPFWNKPPDPEYQYWFERIKGKLVGYMERPDITLRRYPESDKDLVATYARIYAYQKALNWDKAMESAKDLIKRYPRDPFFQEIAGQILFENGKAKEALNYYREANLLAPRQSLLMTALAQTLVSLETEENDNEAQEILENVVIIDPENNFAWRQLGTIYNRAGNDDLTSLAMAEMFLLQGQIGEALFHATKAIDNIPEGTPKWLRLQDIIYTARANIDDKKNRRLR